MREYAYYDHKKHELDMPAMLADLASIPPGSAVLFHTCAHNPTGMDPTQAQWRQIAAVCKQNKLYPFFDNTYQGFVSGCPETDAFAPRHFVAEGLEIIVA